VQADRLLSILMLLDAQRRMTARELAEKVEVSVRTIYRDVDALSAAGVPVFATRGNGGGCCLPDGYHLRLSGLTSREAQALSLPGPARVLADLGLAGVADLAARKLIHALPTALRQEAEAARERIVVEAAGWDAPQESVEHLGVLQAAVWQEQRVALRYRRADGSWVERLVDPLGLVAKGSVWYLVAAVDADVRTYRVSRVQDVRLTGQAIIRPRDFDLAAFWRAASADFKARLPRYATLMRVASSVLPAVRQVRRVSIDAEQSDGPDHVRAGLAFDSVDDAAAFALTWGRDVEVLQPVELRQQVASAARELARRYRAPTRARQSARSSRMS
jgi:predicted DNA-binding transcriptional regulator YafY